MCYVKPGPRCSNHTMKAYNKAVAQHGPYSKEAFHSLQEYLKTPEGIKRLRSEGQHELAQQYERERADAIKAYHAAEEAKRVEERLERIRDAVNGSGLNLEIDVSVETDADGTVVIHAEHTDMDGYIDSMTSNPAEPSLIGNWDELVDQDIREVIERRYASMMESVHEWGPRVADCVSPSAIQDAVGEGTAYRVEDSYDLDNLDFTEESVLESFRGWYDGDLVRCVKMEQLDTLSRVKGVGGGRTKVAKSEIKARLRNFSTEDVQVWCDDPERTTVARLARKELARRAKQFSPRDEDGDE